LEYSILVAATVANPTPLQFLVLFKNGSPHLFYRERIVSIALSLSVSPNAQRCAVGRRSVMARWMAGSLGISVFFLFSFLYKSFLTQTFSILGEKIFNFFTVFS